MTENHGYMGFVGVSTKESSIMRVFPQWAAALDLPTQQLLGHDLPLEASREDYRRLVERIKHDPNHRGALVTTHKMNLHHAAADLFDELDAFASACGEISSISKRGSALIGRAKDPITVALALDDFLPANYFASTGAEVLILGAGGSGTALSWALSERVNDMPTRITVTARSQSKLDHLREVHGAHGTPAGLIRYQLAESDAQTDAIVAALPERSLVVNATGLGKDRPGSPLTDAVRFPLGGIAWEFNYRGSLEFLHQAERQSVERELTVVDGWRYFIHGWTQVIADVFDLELTPERVEELADIAGSLRN